MKGLFLSLFLIMTILIISCVGRYPASSERNPRSLELIRDVKNILEPIGLKISDYRSDGKTLLLNYPTIYLVTESHRFLDKEKAKKFMEKVLKDVRDVVNQPKYRVYLDTYPVDLNKIFICITCFDKVTGLRLEPPYYSYLVFDKGNYRFEYDDVNQTKD